MVNYALQNTPPGPVLPMVERLIKTLGYGHIFEHQVNKLSLAIVRQMYDVNVDYARLPVYTAQANLALSKKNLAHLIQVSVCKHIVDWDLADCAFCLWFR